MTHSSNRLVRLDSIVLRSREKETISDRSSHIFLLAWVDKPEVHTNNRSIAQQTLITELTESDFVL